MDVLANGVALGDRRDDWRTEVLRMRAREADPLDPGHLVASAQELTELRSDVGCEVATPGVDVLAEERYLAHAAIGEHRHLGDDLARTPTLFAPAHGRDDAVRTHGVAPHRHLYPRLDALLYPEREMRGEVVVRAELPARDCVSSGLDPPAEMRDRAWAERHIDERVLIEDPVPLSLRVAAADGDDEIGPLTLAGSGVPEIRSQSGVGLLPDRAGVKDQDVRVGRVDRLSEPERLEHALDPLGVVGVHLAPERGDVVAPHGFGMVALSLSAAQPGSSRGPGSAAQASRCSTTRPSDPKRRSDVPAIVSTELSFEVITPHQSIAARSPSTTG